MKEKNKVIWGTGVNGGRFASSFEKDEIAFFVDSNEAFRGTVFWGKRVVHPCEIVDWSKLYLYIPFNYAEEIKSFLIKHGISDNDYEIYTDRVFISEKRFDSDYKDAIKELELKSELLKGRCIYWGNGWWSKRSNHQAVKRMTELFSPEKMAIVSEVTWISREETETEAGVASVLAPIIFDSRTYVGGIKCDESIQEFFTVNYKMRCVAEQMLFATSLSREEAYAQIYYAYEYIVKVMTLINPVCCFCFDSVSDKHRIIQCVCEKSGIPIVFMHPAVIPGTLSFDVGGEVGESVITLYSDKFIKLDVNYGDIENALRVWDFLFHSKINRKIQPKNDCVEFIKARIMPDRPIVTFLGQNDVNSRMVPYDENAKRYYSPIFESSIEAAIYLANLCKKNNWNFVYKPHPMYTQPEYTSQLPDNTIFVEFGDINDIIDISDVLITILSTANYNALTRYKPVVMLGYNQIKGKGCAYEAYEIEKIEPEIKKALEYGFTQEQQEAFLVHIAQLLKYYLYDDLKERDLRYGKEIPDNIEGFFELKNLLK